MGMFSQIGIDFLVRISCIFSRKLNCIVLKKLGKIGGDDSKVRSRLRHILSAIDPGADFSISEVYVPFLGDSLL